jgi:hypothetical protein
MYLQLQLLWKHEQRSLRKTSKMPCLKCALLDKCQSIFLWIVYIGEVCKQNCWRQRHETVLAFATLGDTTRNRNNSICVMPPKVAKASAVLCCCRWHYRAYFTNGNTALMKLHNIARRVHIIKIKAMKYHSPILPWLGIKPRIFWVFISFLSLFLWATASPLIAIDIFFILDL